MTRPTVSVVMPFAGDEDAAREALATLRSLRLAPGDELILADNSGSAPPAPGVTIVRAVGERSPAHARNAGAQHAGGEWILFIDADCEAPADLLDAYFDAPVEEAVGALVGEVRPGRAGEGLASSYGAARNFLSQSAHLAHPYRPRAAAANLCVRREAFAGLGGFVEGVRAAEDTDFSWRLQEAGWRLELRPHAAVEHRYRSTVRELRRQWRAYAAGRAWLARRYPGFVPEPAVRRGLRRALHRSAGARRQGRGAGGQASGRWQRARFAALDTLLSAEELAGLMASNRPAAPARGDVRAVLVAERFPAAGDPLVELARALDGVRVEAAARPRHSEPAAAGALAIAYREDDGVAERVRASLALIARSPVRCLRDVLAREPGAPSLPALAPAAARIERDGRVRLLALGGPGARAVAARLAALTGRALDDDPDAG